MLQNTRRRCSRTHSTAINSARAPVDAGVRGISLLCDRHRAIRCGGRVSALPAGPTQQGQVNPRASSPQRLLAAATGFEAQHRLHATEGTAHTGKLLLRSALPCVLASSACAGCNRARDLLCSPELRCDGAEHSQQAVPPTAVRQPCRQSHVAMHLHQLLRRPSSFWQRFPLTDTLGSHSNGVCHQP